MPGLFFRTKFVRFDRPAAGKARTISPRENTLNIFSKNKHFIIYTLIGAWCEVLDFCIFYILMRYTEMHVLSAHVISVNAGLLCSFLMNTKINFRTPDKLIRRFFMFFAIAWVGLAFSSALMVFMVEYLHLYDVGSKIFTIIVAGLYQYVMNKRFTYRIIKTTEEGIKNTFD